MDYKITLESFEGPLDLLLNLIEKAKIDIYDIPINIITEQYMDYLYEMEELNLEIASEFILMASTLLQIKSKMLLPEESIDEEVVEEDPREELVLRLLAYKKYKEVANKLRQYEKEELKAYYKPREDLSVFENEAVDLGSLDIKLIVKSINNIISKRGIKEEIVDIQEIDKDEYTVKDCTVNIVSKLKKNKKILFTELLNEKSTRSEIVAYFLSVLELIKLKIINVEQNKNFSDLIIMERK